MSKWTSAGCKAPARWWWNRPTIRAKPRSSWRAWAPTGNGLRLSDQPVQSRQPIRASLRLAATAELKARGIHYLLIKPENPGADDLRRYPAFWGLTVAGSVGDVRLFHIK